MMTYANTPSISPSDIPTGSMAQDHQQVPQLQAHPDIKTTIIGII
jgi:hypothetical protein